MCLCLSATCSRLIWSRPHFSRWDITQHVQTQSLQLLKGNSMHLLSASVFFCFFSSLAGQQYRTSSQYIVKPKPTVSQSESTTRRALIYGIQDDNGTDIQNFALDLTPPPDVLIRTREGTSDGMNVLGIVIFSATMGKKKQKNKQKPWIIPLWIYSMYRCEWECF